MSEQATEKRTIEQIAEAEAGSVLGTAIWLHGIQTDVCNFLDQYRGHNDPGHPIDWDLIEFDGLPREFIEALDKVARYEVRL